MDQEKKISTTENVIEDDTNFANQEEVLVPDDAFADSVVEEKSISEMLPQSLTDNDEFKDEEDELFTDEEIAVLTQSIETQKDEKHDADDVSESADPQIEQSPNRDNKVNRTRMIDNCFDILEMFVFALAFVLIGMAFCFRHSVVDGSSMENTLYEGEHLIISDLFYKPKAGDIVVVQDLSKKDIHTELAKPIVKRIIATGGQTVRICENGEVYVDDELLDEAYVHIDDGANETYDDLTITVPQGYVFLMGDHRNISMDSRRGGVFSEDAILGKVILRFYPFDTFGIVE